MLMELVHLWEEKKVMYLEGMFDCAWNMHNCACYHNWEWLWRVAYAWEENIHACEA